MVKNENETAKQPSVKRVKIPVVRPVQPAPKGTVVQPAKTPVSVSPELQDEKPTTETNATPEPEKEPDLPPDSAPVSSPIEAEEIEKAPARKKRRARQQPLTPAEIAKKKAEKQLNEAKVKAKSILAKKSTKLAILIGFIGISLYVGYSSLPTLAERKLPKIFASNGIPLSRFTLKSLTIDTMELTNLSDSAGQVNVSSVKLNYSLQDLLQKSTVKSVDISGATLKGVKKKDSISLGVLGDLITAPMQKNKKTALKINSLKINNSKLVFTDESDLQKEPISINFSSTGFIENSAVNLNVLTSYKSSVLNIDAETKLKKSALASQIETKITKGDVLKDGENAGSVTGNLDISVDDGVLSKGQADLLLSSSSQLLKLKAEVVPQKTGFDLDVNLERSFENKEDAKGQFVGDLSLTAKNMIIKGSAEDFQGNLPLSISSTSLTNGKINVNGLKTELKTQFACRSKNCQVQLTEPMKFGFNDYQMFGELTQLKMFKPISLMINPSTEKNFLTSNGFNLTFNLPISGFSTQALISDRSKNYQTAVALNQMNVDLQYNLLSGAYSAETRIANSLLATKSFKAAGIQGAISFQSGKMPSTRLRVPKVLLTKKDFLPEFSIDLTTKPLPGYRIAWDSKLNIQNGLVSSQIEGEYDLMQNQWKLFVLVPKFILSDSDLNINATVPFLKKVFPENTTGGIAAQGRITIDKNNVVRGPLKVLFENIKTNISDAKLQGVNGVVELTSIYPLATAKNQRIFMGILDLGIPFRNALFNYEIIENKGFSIASARMKFAAGEFKTVKPFTVPFSYDAKNILFEGSGINLSSVTNNLKSSALRLDGEINSIWNLSIKKNKVLIDEAVFTSKLPGMIHFEPSAAVKKAMNPQMSAFLKDVIVKDLGLKLSGEMAGPINFNVAIKGHPPLDTVEQDVKFDFKGSFKQFLKQEMKPFSIPSDVLLSLQEYEK